MYRRGIQTENHGAEWCCRPGCTGNRGGGVQRDALPGGEVLDVKLVKSSGVPAYDAAVERAIHAADAAAGAQRSRTCSSSCGRRTTSSGRSNEKSNRYTLAPMKITGRPKPSRHADNKHRRPWRIATSLLLCLCAATARAQLTIEIIGGGADQIPITVLPLRPTRRSSSSASARSCPPISPAAAASSCRRSAACGRCPPSLPRSTTATGRTAAARRW